MRPTGSPGYTEIINVWSVNNESKRIHIANFTEKASYIVDLNTAYWLIELYKTQSAEIAHGNKEFSHKNATWWMPFCPVMWTKTETKLRMFRECLSLTRYNILVNIVIYMKKKSTYLTRNTNSNSTILLYNAPEDTPPYDRCPNVHIKNISF